MRTRRLTGKAQFAEALRHSAVTHTEHFSLHTMTAALPNFEVGPWEWMGVVLPKRWANRAVTRNALRRQIYSHLQQRDAVDGRVCVVRLRRGFDPCHFPSAWSSALRTRVRSELASLLAMRRV